MRLSWILCGALLVAAFGFVLAGPVEAEQSGEEGSSRWRTFHALKNFFSPVTNYFRGLPAKTPSDVATDVKDTVTDVKEWARDNEAIQTLVGALVPVKNWLKEKANVLQDKTFKEMYDDVKTRVSTLDEHIGSWIEQRNSQKYK
ncbi:hypothetical protein SK128_016514 [Halocaridina rubra]|uniref:Apolipoprotein C-I n=1 Tax=Halocaridina rubra TaxID=373956 RepID=A0AAN8XG49_HALRR